MDAHIGVIGMAVMGSSLALNIESRGYVVAVYNRTAKRTEDFVKERAQGKKIIPSYTLSDFVATLKKPRKIILMVKAGDPVDKTIDALISLLEKGDILIDGGNSYYKDTERRIEKVHKYGLRYIGLGISGGESGALHGPSMMAGGDEDAYREVEEIFKKAAAKTDDGPCVAYLGKGSAGHFVKMTHNGIEYAHMEAIAEVYDIMREALSMEIPEIHKIFKEWNKGRLSSYLIEITSNLLTVKDRETGHYMVDIILDKAKSKGTGKWTTQTALDLGVPVPSIAMAVFARILSAYKDERVAISRMVKSEKTALSPVDGTEFLDILEAGLYTSMLIIYAQGLHLLYVASNEYQYGLDLSEVCRIWKGGCIIRAKVLNDLKEIYLENKDLSHLFLSEKFMNMLRDGIPSLREVVLRAKEVEIPLPVLSSALDYLDGIKREKLPANIIQAQRDYFGAHTFERRDREGVFHVEWEKEAEDSDS